MMQENTYVNQVMCVEMTPRAYFSLCTVSKILIVTFSRVITLYLREIKERYKLYKSVA